MDNIKNILKGRLSADMQKKLAATEVCQVAKELGLCPVSFKAGRLKVYADSPATAEIMRFEAGKHITALNEKLGSEVVESISTTFERRQD